MFSSSSMSLQNKSSHPEQNTQVHTEIHWVCSLLHTTCRGGIVGKDGNNASVGRVGSRGFRNYLLETMDKREQRQILLKGNRVMWCCDIRNIYFIFIPACIITMRKTLDTPNNLRVRDSLASSWGYIGWESSVRLLDYIMEMHSIFNFGVGAKTILFPWIQECNNC